MYGLDQLQFFFITSKMVTKWLIFVIFVGSGCTGAVAKLIHGLNLSEPPIGIFNYFIIC